MKFWVALIIAHHLLIGQVLAVENFYSSSTARLGQKLGIAPQVRVEISLIARADEVSLSSSRVFLGDVFDCMAPITVCHEIQAVDLGQSPDPGQIRSVSLDDMAELIHADLGQHYDAHIEGPAAIRLKSEALVISREQIEAELLQALHAKLRPDRRVSIRSLYVRSGLRIYPGDLEWDFPEIASVVDEVNTFQSGTPKMHEIDLNLLSRHQGVISASQVKVRFRLQVLMQAPVALVTLPFGDSIRPANFSFDWVEVNHQPLLDLESVSGMRLARRVMQGQYLRKSDVNEPYLVMRGQAVDVILKSGGIKLQSQARALSSARLGESVPVQLAHNRRRLSGQVISSSTVKVLE